MKRLIVFELYVKISKPPQGFPVIPYHIEARIIHGEVSEMYWYKKFFITNPIKCTIVESIFTNACEEYT